MKPKLLAVSATDTVPAILCVAATGSDPAQGSDTSVAAAMLSSKLFFDGAGTHRPLPERKAGHISVLSGGSSADGAGVAGTVTIVTVKHGRSSASLAASPLSPDNGVREYSSGVGRSAAEQRNVKVGREPWYACARSAGDCFIRCRSRASMRMAGLWLYKSSPVLYAQSMKRCGPVLRVYIFCFVCFYAYHLK